MKTLFAALLSLTAALSSASEQTSQLVTVAENGPRVERVNVVLLAEGYTASELSSGKFDRDAATISEALFATEPYRSYRQFFNVYGIRVSSNQSGADYGAAGGFRDTYFHTSFNTAGVDRYLTVGFEGYSRVFSLLNQHVPEHDIVVVVVNDSKYGGAGGHIAVTSTNPSAPEIAIHEIGHSFARLTDEYEYSGGQAWDAPNVSTQTSLPLLKWRGWVAPGTSLPTAETVSNGSGKVGLFEGAAYQTTGTYRPTLDSKMRTLGQPFYAVNEEAIVLSIYRTIAPITSVSPATTTVIANQPEQQLQFAANGANPAAHAPALRVEWFLNGQLHRSGSARSLSLNALDLGNGQHSLLVRVTDPSGKVRTDTDGLLVDQYQWSISVSQQPQTPPSLVSDLANLEVTEGKSATLQVIAAGPKLSYQWLRAGQPISGQTSDTLRFPSTKLSDASNYCCRVSNPFGQIESASVALTVSKMTSTPVVVPTFEPGNTIFATVSGDLDLSFAAEGAVRYSVRGLPRGLRFDPVTGRISGKGERPGTYVIFITATSASGLQTTTTVPLVVAAMTGAGAWQTVLPNAQWNAQLGAQLQVQVSAIGAATGSLRIAGKTLPFKARVNAQTEGWTLVLPQIGKSGLALSLSATGETLSAIVSAAAESTTATGYRAFSGEQFTIHSLPWLATLGEGAFGQMITKLAFRTKWGYRIPTGTVSWAGRLPDGSAFTGSSRLNSSLEHFSLWTPLWKNQASLAGESQLAGLDYYSGITPTQSGQLQLSATGTTTSYTLSGSL